MKKLFVFTINILLLIAFVTPVSAQSGVGQVGDTGFKIDPVIGLQPVSITFFNQIALPGGPYSTVLSWISFGGSIASIGLIVFWIYRLIKASAEALQSEGNEEGLAEAYKKVKSVFIGAALAILFPVGLSVIGFLMGLGPIWSWPAALRSCPGANGTDSGFYFQEVLKQVNNGVSDPTGAADAACGYDFSTQKNTLQENL